MKKSTKNMLFAFVLNFGFSVIELVGGILTNSISIISDSIHDLGDSASIGAALLLERKSERKPDERYTFGYLRFSVMGAVITAMILLVGSVFVVYRSVGRFLSPAEVDYNGMLILAVIGSVVNGAAAWKTARGHSLNEKTLSLHMLEDVLGWVAILVGSIVIKLTGWHLIDPILSVFIAVFILLHSFKHLKEALNIVLQKAPQEICMAELKAALCKTEGVKDVHHIHLWTMDGAAHYASLHAWIEEGTHDALEQIKHDLRHTLAHHGIVHSTIELEYQLCNHTECEVPSAEHEHHHHHHHH